MKRFLKSIWRVITAPHVVVWGFSDPHPSVYRDAHRMAQGQMHIFKMIRQS